MSATMLLKISQNTKAVDLFLHTATKWIPELLVVLINI